MIKTLADKNFEKDKDKQIFDLGKKLCVIFVCFILLGGCGVADKETWVAEEEIEVEDSIRIEEVESDVKMADGKQEAFLDTGEEKEDGQIEVRSKNDNSNNLYSAVKFYDNYFYFSDADGLKRMSKDLLTKERIAEGNVMFGNCDNDYIYYIRYPSDLVKDPGIFRMDLNRHIEEKLMEWSESMWGINEIYAYQDVIYLAECLGENGFCKAYEVIGGNIEEINKKDNIVYQQLDKCGILHSDINNLLFGYLNMIFEYHKLLYFDGQKNEITVYDTESGKKIVTLDQCRSDVLVSDKGFIYKDLENNIFLKKWDTDEPNILYDMSEHDNRFVNYGTFDEQYIYGFYEDGDKCTLVKIKWEGGCEIGRTFEDVKLCIHLSFSANNGTISYLQGGHRVFENN